MKKSALLLFAVMLVCFFTACAGPRFQTLGNFKNLQKTLSQEKKVAVDQDVVFYHELEKKDGRVVVKGKPDMTPEYVELALVVVKEIEKQLTAQGFLVTEDGPNILKLKIYGIEKKVYVGFINHFVGVLVEARVGVGQEILLFCDLGAFYNPVFSKEKMIRNTVAPGMVKLLKKTLDETQ